MTRFAPLLQHASARIDLPQPTKSRILLEMAGDLEDLFQHHLSQGLDETEAARRAEEAFAITDDNLRSLIMIHKSAIDRFGDALASQVGTWWEKLLLFLFLGIALLLASGVALRTNVLERATLFVWPILGLAVVAFAIVFSKLAQLFRPGDLDVRRFRRNLWMLLFFAVGILTVGVFGFFVEICFYFNQAAHASGLENMSPPAGIFAEQIAVMMNVTMLSAILTAIAWFLLVSVAASLEKRRAAELLEV